MKNLSAIIEFSLINIQFVIAQKIDESLEVLESTSFPIEFYNISDNKERLKETNKICNILLEIKRSIKTYGVSSRNIRLFAGDSLNDLKNKEFLKEQIRIKTGFNLEILDISSQAIFLYKKMLNLYGETLRKELSMFLFISYDKVSFYVLSKGRVIYYQTISFTPIKLKDILTELNFNPEKTEALIDQYLKSYFDTINNFFPSKKPTNLFVISENFGDVLSNKKNTPKDLFNAIDKLTLTSEIKIKKTYHIDDDDLKFFKEKLWIAKAAIKASGISSVTTINYSLINTLLYNSFYVGARRKFDTEVKISTLKSCEHLGKRYLNDLLHVQNVKLYASLIFLQLAKVHQLTSKDLLILESAAILHDIGKYVNLRDHHKNSYDLINNSSIFGLSEDDKKKIAILSYFHSKKEPSIDHRFFATYNDSEKIKIIKLIAILKVADSLDRSHKQQVKDIIIKIDNSNMILELAIADEPLIEKRAFEKKSELFSEVFGLNVKLILRR